MKGTTRAAKPPNRQRNSTPDRQQPQGQTDGRGHSNNIPESSRFLQKYLGNSYVQAQAAAIPPMVQEVLRAAGRPLDPATRTSMESRFGADFSQVRVHTETRAAESALAMNAQAYTVGKDVVFSQGQYAPHSPPGAKLLAHELAHVIQQKRGGSTPPPLRGGELEQHADAAASAFTAGSGPIRVGGASAQGIARQPLSGSPDPGFDRRPRSLKGSLIPTTLTDDALEMEIASILEWLETNPAQSAERHILTLALEPLQAEESRRIERLRRQQKYQEQVARIVASVEAGRIPKWMKVFPFLPSHLFSLDVAPIMARREGEYIVVQLPVMNVALNKTFEKEVKTLHWDVFRKEGLKLRPDELVGVRLYDEDKKVVVVYAKDLLKFAEASDRAVFKNIIITAVSAIGAPIAARVGGRIAGAVAGAGQRVAPLLTTEGMTAAASRLAPQVVGWASRNPYLALAIAEGTVATALQVGEDKYIDPVQLIFNLLHIRASAGSSRASRPSAPSQEVEPDMIIHPRKLDPRTGKVTATVFDRASGTHFDAEVDLKTGNGQITDRKTREVIGIVVNGEVTPARTALPAGETPPTLPTPPKAPSPSSAKPPQLPPSRQPAPPRLPKAPATAAPSVPPQRPKLDVLVVGAENRDEFAYAESVTKNGGNVVVANPRVTAEAEAYRKSGGNFFEGKIEALPADARFNLIREDFPYPLDQAFVPTRQFVDARMARLKPGGAWVVITEKPEFVATLELAGQQANARVTVNEIPLHHEATPKSTHAQRDTRFALTFTKGASAAPAPSKPVQKVPQRPRPVPSFLKPQKPPVPAGPVPVAYKPTPVGTTKPRGPASTADLADSPDAAVRAGPAGPVKPPTPPAPDPPVPEPPKTKDVSTLKGGAPALRPAVPFKPFTPPGPIRTLLLQDYEVEPLLEGRSQWKTILTDKATGKKSLFKPQIGETDIIGSNTGIEPLDRYRRAPAAALLAHESGIATPDAEIVIVKEGNKELMGSLQDWVTEGANAGKYYDEPFYPAIEKSQKKLDLDAFDYVIANMDRNPGNWKVVLDPQTNEVQKLIAIDMDDSLPPGSMRYSSKKGPRAPHQMPLPPTISQKLYDRLRHLSANRAVIEKRLRTLQKSEIDGVFTRLGLVLTSVRAGQITVVP